MENLLRGLSALEFPSDWECRVLIIDNDPDGSAAAICNRARKILPVPLNYVIEDEPGIPAARNRAIDEVSKEATQLLCFLDDDEFPARDWLTEMIKEWRRSKAALLGGPLRRVIEHDGGTTFQRFFAHSLIARRKLAERRAERRWKEGLPVPVYTSNWLCNVDIIRQHQLRFDTTMRFSGGSDAEFYLRARSLGLKTSWCPTAIVVEPISPIRNTVAYQFRRSRDQGIVAASLQCRRPSLLLIEHCTLFVVGMTLILLPLLGMASLATGIHLMGSSAGHLASLFGKQSNLYQRHDQLA